MRIEIGISAALHTALLVASAVALPSAEAFNAEEPAPVPVEIFTVAEFTKLAGKRTETPPEITAPAAPEPPKAVEPPKIVEAPPKPAKTEAPPPVKIAALKPPPLPATVEVLPPQPLPLAEPVARPEPEPEPVAAPEPEPIPEPEPEVAKVPPPSPAINAPAPRKKPKPPKTAKPKPKKKREFNPDKIAALLNKVQDDNAGPKPAPAAGRTDDGATDVSGLDMIVTQSEMRYLQTQMQRCWNPPIGVADAASLNVKVEVRFNRVGRLEAAPVVLNSGGEGFEVAANAAVRAVQQCQPYDMPAEKYDNWHQVIVNFDPKFMLGG